MVARTVENYIGIYHNSQFWPSVFLAISISVVTAQYGEICLVAVLVFVPIQRSSFSVSNSVFGWLGFQCLF